MRARHTSSNVALLDHLSDPKRVDMVCSAVMIYGYMEMFLALVVLTHEEVMFYVLFRMFYGILLYIRCSFNRHLERATPLGPVL